MEKVLFTTFGLLILLASCQPARQSDSYRVEGELRDSSSHGKTIYIMQYDDSKLIDSTKVEGNRFVFTGKVDTATFCRIDVSYEEFGSFILENGNIRVNLKACNEPSGTPQNDEMARISLEEDSIYSVLREKRKELKKQYSDPKEFNTHWEAFIKASGKGWRDRLMELYKTHNNDAVGLFLTYTFYMKETETDVQKAAIATFGPWLKSRRVVRDLLGRIEAQEKTAEGQPFADIKGKDPNGRPVALSDYFGKGNYVLMDMWSSWCGPCLEQIPHLKQIQEKYRNKGLTVLGIFVWDEEENLKGAVETEKITWPQIIDSEETAMKSYGTDGIPFIVLFAPDGTILKRGLWGEGMIRTVDEFMSKNKPE